MDILDNLETENLKKLTNLKMKLIKIAHPNYDVVDICCDKTDIMECFNMDFMNPEKNYLLPMYLVLMKKGKDTGLDTELKFIKYHTYSGCAIGLMAASQFLEDVSDMKNLNKQEKEVLRKRYERENNRSHRG